MKKLLLVILCVMGVLRAENEPVSIDVYSGDIDLCHVSLEPGQTVEIERLWSDDSTVEVRSSNMLSRVGASFFRTVADSPFFTALAVWALVFNRDSIGNHPIKSMVIGGVLISDFALHMLHSDEQKINIAR